MHHVLIGASLSMPHLLYSMCLVIYLMYRLKPVLLCNDVMSLHGPTFCAQTQNQFIESSKYLYIQIITCGVCSRSPHTAQHCTSVFTLHVHLYVDFFLSSARGSTCASGIRGHPNARSWVEYDRCLLWRVLNQPFKSQQNRLQVHVYLLLRLTC